MKLLAAMGTSGRDYHRGGGINPLIQIFQISQIGREQPRGYLWRYGGNGAQLGNDPRQQDNGQICLIGLHLGMPQCLDLVQGQGQAHAAAVLHLSLVIDIPLREGEFKFRFHDISSTLSGFRFHVSLNTNMEPKNQHNDYLRMNNKQSTYVQCVIGFCKAAVI